MNQIPSKFSTKKCQVFIDDLGILIQSYNENTELTEKDALEEIKLYGKIIPKKKRPILIDIGNIRTVERNAKSVYASEEAAEFLSATALIISNPVSRIMGNFYMGINKTKMPVRMFTSTGDARKWLKDFLP